MVESRRAASRSGTDVQRQEHSADRASGPLPGWVHVGWGLPGALALAGDHDVLVVVDVLSFSTAVSVAVERGAQVWPCALGAAGAQQLAREVGAVLAGGRSDRGGPTLSPASLLHLPEATRLVLPSPNGSAIAQAVAGAGVPVVSACLRGASAAVALLARFRRVGLVAAGERFPDRSLRPAYEDWLGCGVLVQGLVACGFHASPDAVAAAAAAAAPRPLHQCESGQELTAAGFDLDVRLADSWDVTSTVAVLAAGRFSAAPPDWSG